MTLLEIEDLSISFKQYTSRFKQDELEVIHQLHVMVEEGEIVAIVGSSGSGKSLLAHALLGILPNHATVKGRMYYNGHNLTKQRIERLRGCEIAFVPQSVTYLDPTMKVGKQVRNAVRNGNKNKAQEKVFHDFQLDKHVADMYPYELSGGMARRILLAIAKVSGAKLFVADEPTPGLDAEVMKDTLASFRKLADDGAAVMMITHDIEMATRIANKVAVFYAGTTVEIAPIEAFKGNGEQLKHPYSQALWKALPQNQFQTIDGHQPLLSESIKGCAFSPRCNWATHICHKKKPEVRYVENGMVRCHHAT
ncbi:ABC transporter ATP-binding protein [Halalkalibacter sp. APA_J-10(15)]|uniref:ABC transporter ATP-binding protein n=1 Tax=unclassified Halalkalibacter TaxID=2893063 RepID=UPI001FF4A2F5|nr:ABC transporter ATP-binding protein [Halalkalibacter sp. APA_J-10(15)]MCK0472386.1 ABC transporter ATP-binding protein [Halalkalibacter sp. APA_J-10(15)]